MPDTNDKFRLWMIYDHPSDYPDSYVARLSVISSGVFEDTNEMFIADTLEEVRKLLPRGLACLSRDPDDDKAIVEVWL
jgi:hypothetical protein